MNFNLLKQAGHGIAHLFYPLHCSLCNRELSGTEEVLCLPCVLQLPRTGFHHILNNPSYQNFTGRIPIEKATSLVYFTKEGMMQHLMHHFKYKGKAVIGKYMGKLLGEELKKYNWLDNIDAIIPVPLHRKKEFKRGFNQSASFAEGIAETSGKPVLSHILKRIKNTSTQTHKSRAERIDNMRDVFELRNKEQINQKHLLLVDDVLTTGATLEACALALLKQVNVKISIATLALAID